MRFNLIGPWAKNDDGAYFKAALLSGSPGVGNWKIYINFFIIVLFILTYF